jgi:hypothetical protein
MKDWPLVIFLVCIGVIIYLFLSEGDEDSAPVFDSDFLELEPPGFTLDEAEYHE